MTQLHTPNKKQNIPNMLAKHLTNHVIGWRQWDQLQLALLLRQEEQGLLLLCGHGGLQGDP